MIKENNDEDSESDNESERREMTCDDQELEEKNFFFKRNLEDSKAEKFFNKYQSIKSKRNLLKLMVEKSATNERKSSGFRLMTGRNDFAKLKSSQDDLNRPKTSHGKEKKRFFLT